MSEPEQADEALSRLGWTRLPALLAERSDATADLTALLRDIHERDPNALDRFHPKPTLAGSGWRLAGYVQKA